MHARTNATLESSRYHGDDAEWGRIVTIAEVPAPTVPRGVNVGAKLRTESVAGAAAAVTDKPPGPTLSETEAALPGASAAAGVKRMHDPVRATVPFVDAIIGTAAPALAPDRVVPAKAGPDVSVTSPSASSCESAAD